MTALKLVYGPSPIYKEKADIVAKVDDEIIQLCNDLRDTLYEENAVGIAAPMVGILKRIIVVDLQENGIRSPFSMINPEITWSSKEIQEFEEGSVSFPGISAMIKRAKAISVVYLNHMGQTSSKSYEGYIATVIQHEIDYLNGKIFLDYLSPVKRKLLLKKTKKLQKDYSR